MFLATLSWFLCIQAKETSATRKTFYTGITLDSSPHKCFTANRHPAVYRSNAAISAPPLLIVSVPLAVGATKENEYAKMDKFYYRHCWCFSFCSLKILALISAHNIL